MIPFLPSTVDTYSLLAPPVGVEIPLQGVGDVVWVLDIDRLAAAVEVPPAEPHGLGPDSIEKRFWLEFLMEIPFEMPF